MHYYGDIVRKLFLAGAVIMLFSLPYASSKIWEPTYLFIFAILVLALIAGFISPEQKLVMVSNAIVAALAFLIFEYDAVWLFTKKILDPLFFIDQVLALNFIVALYYSSKTIRGTFLE